MASDLTQSDLAIAPSGISSLRGRRHKRWVALSSSWPRLGQGPPVAESKPAKHNRSSVQNPA
eukprot:8710662-Pyramimonas_sp.AAC.1